MKNKNQRDLTTMSKKEKEIETVELQPVDQFSQAAQAYGTHSPVVTSHLTTIQQYIDAMSPGIMVDDRTGAMWQNRLYNAMLGIIRLDNVGDMIDGMDGVMDYFRNYANGAMHLTYTQRFLDVWMVDEHVRDLYGHLCVIFSTYADPEKRARHAHHMHIAGTDGVLKHLEPEARSRLVQYLQRYTL